MRKRHTVQVMADVVRRRAAVNDLDWALSVQYRVRTPYRSRGEQFRSCWCEPKGTLTRPAGPRFGR